METSTAQRKNEAVSNRRQSNVPLGTGAIPRFAPTDAALGVTCAQQILEEFRKMLEGVDLKTKTPKKRAQKQS